MRKACVFRLIAAVVSALLLLAGVGCGGKPVGPSADDSLQRVLDSGRLVIGLDTSFPPMGFYDDENNIVGFDVDVAQAVCERLGIELVKQPVNWEKKEEYLNSGEIDCIWNGLSANDKRAATMLLSEPYMKNEMVFVFPKSRPVKSVEELKGKTVGVQAGSAAQDLLKTTAFFPDLTVCPLTDNIALFDAVTSGGLDAIFLDSVLAYYYISSSEDCLVLPADLGVEEYAIGFRKSDILLRDRIQEVLTAMNDDGKLAEISVKWFGINIVSLK